MATYEISGPNGESYDIEGPDDADPAAVISQISGVKAQPSEAVAPAADVPTSKASDPDLYDATDESHKKALRIGREVMRLFGQGATNLAEGVMALPKMVADIPVNAANLAGADLPTFSSRSLAEAPELAPQNESERLGTAITRSIGATAGGIGVGAAVPAVAPLAANPGMQLAGAVTGPTASEVAREAGAGRVGQAVAGIAGAVAPGALGAGAVAATRGAIRGSGDTEQEIRNAVSTFFGKDPASLPSKSGRQTVADNIATFERAGTTPTVGQATESRSLRAAENTLASVPGASGKIVGKAEAQAGDLAANIEQRASQLVRKTTGEQAGRKIQDAVSGEGGFVERFKAQQGELYDRLDKFLPSDALVGVNNTQRTLKTLTTPVKGAEATTGRLINKRLTDIASDLGIDAAQGTIPYEALKQLRTRVGAEIADATLASDVPRSQWKQLYGALSSDLEAAAKQAGPGATAAWSRANNYTRAGMRRLESIDHVIDKNGGPEAVFRAATAGTKEGATTLRAVMQSVDDEGKKIITATMLRRLGAAKAGAQNELGDQFSTETFLTNWNGLSKEARSTLFDRYGPSFRADMDAIAKTAANLREGSQVFRNPSGTAQKSLLIGTLTALGGAIGTGQAGVAAGIGAGIGSANLTARLMTNPQFVKWLAQTTKAPAGAYTAAVNSLATQASKSGDMDLARAVALLEQSQEYQTKSQNRRAQGQ